jgi:hypothetical protein
VAHASLRLLVPGHVRDDLQLESDGLDPAFAWPGHLGTYDESLGACGWTEANKQTDAAGPEAFQSPATNMMLTMNRSFIVGHSLYPTVAMTPANMGY